MKNAISLVTSGYDFVVYVSSLVNSNDRLGIVTSLIPNQHYKISPIRSKAKTIFLEDLKKFSLYLEEHLNNHLKDDSHIFMGYDCTFQIQALGGVISPYGNIPPEDGDMFTIRCLVNVTDTESTSFSDYFGGESTVTVGNCRKFIKLLKENYFEFKDVLLLRSPDLKDRVEE